VTLTVTIRAFFGRGSGVSGGVRSSGARRTAVIPIRQDVRGPLDDAEHFAEPTAIHEAGVDGVRSGRAAS